MITKFQLTLNSQELPLSSFGFYSNSGGNTGSAVTQSLQYSQFIIDNIDQTVTLNMILGGVTTEILTCKIEHPNESEGPTKKSQSLIFEDIVFSGTIPSAFEIDDLIQTRQLQNGFYNFTIPYYADGWQYGMTVNYNSVDRFIGSVSFSKAENGVPSISLTEDTEPPDDEEIEEESGKPGCTRTLTIGIPSNNWFHELCSSGYDSSSSETHFSPEGYNYDMFVFHCDQFTLAGEFEVVLEFSVTGPPGLDTSGIASGYEFDLIEGEYTPFTDPTPTIYTFRGNGTLTTTLPGGIYTCRSTLYIDRTVNPESWITTPYYVYVRLA